MSVYGEARRSVRKRLALKYQGYVNRRDARAIAFRPQSDEGRRAWITYLSLSSSSEE